MRPSYNLRDLVADVGGDLGLVPPLHGCGDLLHLQLALELLHGELVGAEHPVARASEFLGGGLHFALMRATMMR